MANARRVLTGATLLLGLTFLFLAVFVNLVDYGPVYAYSEPVGDGALGTGPVLNLQATPTVTPTRTVTPTATVTATRTATPTVAAATATVTATRPATPTAAPATAAPTAAPTPATVPATGADIAYERALNTTVMVLTGLALLVAGVALSGYLLKRQR